MANFTKFLPTTVFDVEVYKAGTDSGILFTIDSLKIANFTQEGPEKTARGGKNNAILARHGKTTRLEMEDAVVNAKYLEALFGAEITEASGDITKIAITDTFPKEVKLVGTTFFINSDDGSKVEATFTVPKFLPDGLLNLTMEAEGDFGVIELGGEVISDCGEFYTIEAADYTCS